MIILISKLLHTSDRLDKRCLWPQGCTVLVNNIAAGGVITDAAFNPFDKEVNHGPELQVLQAGANQGFDVTKT